MTESTIKTLLVDDEIKGRENLSMLLAEFCPKVEVVASASNLRDAAGLIALHDPDLLFLDIQIGSKTIFELLESMDRLRAEIIFVTAHEHFALRAFQFMALDYLLKPIEIPALVKAVERTQKNIGSRSLHLYLKQLMLNLKTMNQDQHKIALATTDGYHLVPVNGLLYCLADGSYTVIYFADGTQLTVSRHLKYYERMLEEYGFRRIHQSALINLRFISKLARTEGGYVEMGDGKRLPINKVSRQELEAAIKTNRRLI